MINLPHHFRHLKLYQLLIFLLIRVHAFTYSLLVAFVPCVQVARYRIPIPCLQLGSMTSILPCGYCCISSPSPVELNPIITTPFVHSAVPRRPKEKKALLIAISYLKDVRLGRPQRDVQDLRALLIKDYGYRGTDITVLTDQASSLDMRPTQFNIMREVEWFLINRQSGDQFFFYFSGHSYQEPSDDPDEEDGMDELILPLDAFDKNGNTIEGAAISDDFLNQYLVDPIINANCTLVAIFDSCHSGTLLDLPHHRCNRVCSLRSPFRRAVRWCHEAEEKALNHFSSLDFMKMVVPDAPTKETAEPIPEMQPSCSQRCSGFCLRRQGVRNNIICISACKDSEQTFEFMNKPSMTRELINLLGSNKRPTLKKLMRHLTEREKVSNEGKPQISSLKPLRMNTVLKL